MKKRNIACGPVENQGWGLLTEVKPGGGKLGIYQPRHPRPKAMSAGKAAKRPAKRGARTPPKKSADGHLASQPRIERPVHFSHSARPERRQHLLAAQTRPTL